MPIPTHPQTLKVIRAALEKVHFHLVDKELDLESAVDQNPGKKPTPEQLEIRQSLEDERRKFHPGAFTLLKPTMPPDPCESLKKITATILAKSKQANSVTDFWLRAPTTHLNTNLPKEDYTAGWL